MSFKYYFSEQLKKHRSILPQDAIKACYQAAFGAEHLLSDTDRARAYFNSEFESVAPYEGELFEMISESVARIDLGAWKKSGMPSEWLFNMFVASSSVKKDGESAFVGYLSEVEDCLAGGAGFSLEEWRAFLEEYRARGGGAVHHSEEYRKNERPSYRIVDSGFLKTFPVLMALKEVSPEGEVGVIAIDGRAASGKTTLSGILSTVLGAEVVHMDDFFLPLELRSAERMRETGGNLHYERFCQEVLPHIGEARGFSYGIFDCGSMSIQGERLIEESEWRIVEGSYSHHPKFGAYADLKVYCTVSPEEQMKRILARNGERMAERFKNEWIPMEERYFQEFDVQAKADVEIS